MALAVCPALAAETASSTGWQVAAVPKPDGSFAFCRGKFTDPKTKLGLAVALSPANEINLGIEVPQGGFKKGDSYPLTLSADKWSKPVEATAMLPDLLLMKLGSDAAFLPALAAADRAGGFFTAKGEVDATTFPLAGAAKMTADLQACVKQGPGMAKAAATLPAGLAALLKEARLDAHPIPLAGGNGPGKSAEAVDEAWTVTLDGAPLDGGFREAHAKKGEDFKFLSEGSVSQLKSQCKPKDGSVLKIETKGPETLQGLSLQTYDLTCGPEFVALLAYRTETDIYGVLLHRTALQYRQQASEARDRLAAIVRRLGNEAPEAGAGATKVPAKPAKK